MNRDELSQAINKAYEIAHQATREGQIENSLHFTGAMLPLKDVLLSHISGLEYNKLYYNYLDSLAKIERMKDRILSLGGTYSDIFPKITDDEQSLKITKI